MLTQTKKYFIIFIFTIWSLLGITLLLGVMPKSPLLISQKIKSNISIVFPNRWPFFTKNPKEDYIYILEKNKNNYTKHKNFPNSSPSNLFGLINYQRAIGMEYGVISNMIDKDLWNVNNDGKNLFEILKNDTIQILKIKKSKEITQLKRGEYIFVEIEPLPYLWRNKINQFNMPSKYIKILIE